MGILKKERIGKERARRLKTERRIGYREYKDRGRLFREGKIKRKRQKKKERPEEREERKQ